MKFVLTLVLALGGTVALGSPAEAAQTRVTIVSAYAKHVSSGLVMSGRINGNSKVVRIDRYQGGRWVLVRKVPTYKRAYRTVLPAVSRWTKFRVGVAGRFSRTVNVAPQKAPRDACGAIKTKADGTPWECTFHDDFSGSALNRSKWTPQTAFAMGSSSVHTCYADDPETIRVADGKLNLSVRKVETPVTCDFGGLTGPTQYVSGGVMTHRLFSQKFGRFEARIKNTATTAPGLHEAFWLWPDDRVASTAVWPAAGEIDISETYSAYPGITVPFLHYSADALGNLLGVNTAWDCAAPRGVYHRFALEWSATKVEIFVNGTKCLTNTSGDPAFLKPYIIALTQGLGAAGNVYDGRAPLGTMTVDYVRVWK